MKSRFILTWLVCCLTFVGSAIHAAPVTPDDEGIPTRTRSRDVSTDHLVDERDSQVSRTHIVQDVKKKQRNFSSLPADIVMKDARYDTTFKILFGEEGGENRAISFLNAVLDLKNHDEQIKKISFLDGSDYKTVDRTIHFDVRIKGLCETYGGHRFIVEMQKSHVTNQPKRWVYYAARELCKVSEAQYSTNSTMTPNSKRDANSNKKYYPSLNPVKVITILDFDNPSAAKEINNTTDTVVHWDIRERASKKKVTDIMSWTYVVLPRFEESLKKLASLKFENKLDGWLYLLTRNEGERLRIDPDVTAKDEDIQQGFYRLSHLNEKEKQAYEDSVKAEVSRQTREQMEYKKGIQEGVKQKALEFALRLMNDKEPLSKIVRYTELSEDSIRTLAAENNIMGY